MANLTRISLCAAAHKCRKRGQHHEAQGRGFRDGGRVATAGEGAAKIVLPKQIVRLVNAATLEPKAPYAQLLPGCAVRGDIQDPFRRSQTTCRPGSRHSDEATCGHDIR